MTNAPMTLINLQKKLTDNLGTTNLGIVGDAEHVRNGGYHIGAATLRNNGMGGDYSLRYPVDGNAQHDYACAIDIGGDPDLLMTLGTRIVHALKARDPRVYRKIRGVNAPYDGQNIDRRYDTQDPSTTGDDHTELSDDRNHIHIEIYRTLVLNSNVIDGLYSVLSGAGVALPPTGGNMASEEYGLLKGQISALHEHLDREIQDMLDAAVAKIQGQISALHVQLDDKIDAAVAQVQKTPDQPA